jgi:hypothetical protein
VTSRRLSNHETTKPRNHDGHEDARRRLRPQRHRATGQPSAATTLGDDSPKLRPCTEIEQRSQGMSPGTRQRPDDHKPPRRHEDTKTRRHDSRLFQIRVAQVHGLAMWCTPLASGRPRSFPFAFVAPFLRVKTVHSQCPSTKARRVHTRNGPMRSPRTSRFNEASLRSNGLRALRVFVVGFALRHRSAMAFSDKSCRENKNAEVCWTELSTRRTPPLRAPGQQAGCAGLRATRCVSGSVRSGSLCL